MLMISLNLKIRLFVYSHPHMMIILNFLQKIGPKQLARHGGIFSTLVFIFQFIYNLGWWGLHNPVVWLYNPGWWLIIWSGGFIIRWGGFIMGWGGFINSGVCVGWRG